MTKVFVERDKENTKKIKNLSTTRYRDISLEVVLDDSTFDFAKVQGYELELNEDENLYHLIFNKTAWDEYFKEIEKEQAIKDGSELLVELTNNIILKTASDEYAYRMRYMYPKWASGVTYASGDRFMYENKFYKVNQDHTSSEEWQPDAAPSLYTEISDPSIEWPEWKQPTQAENAYKKGAKVTHNGVKYISQIDANTTVPGTDERWWKKAE